MKKPFKGKLSLDRETLTVLAGEALDRVGGGNAGAEVHDDQLSDRLRHRSADDRPLLVTNQRAARP